MKGLNLIFTYSQRLLRREWRRFVLPWLSLTITTVVLVLVLLLTASSSKFISQQSRELLGGDIKIEATTNIEVSEFWENTNITPQRQSFYLDFSATILSLQNVLPVSFHVIDDAYPLYGEIVLQEKKYTLPSAEEIYLDVAAASRLEVVVGDKVNFGEVEFVVADIIVSEPSSVFGGFRFLPRVILSLAGFERSGIDVSLLRAEYNYLAEANNLNQDNKTALVDEIKSNNLSVSFADRSNSGLQRGLAQVSDFLIIAVLITAVLAAVNVYASTLYLLAVMRRSFAVLLAIGMKRVTLISTLGLTFSAVVIFSGLLGTGIGSLLFNTLSNYIATNFQLVLPPVSILLYGSLSILLIFAITFGSFVPAVQNVFSVSPRRILIDSETTDRQRIPLKIFLLNTFSTLIPVILLASFLLKSLWAGTVVISAIILVYVLVATGFYFLLSFIYKRRAIFSFWFRSIISQKKADGLFGVVSFTSLFVALVALGSLVLIQVSLERFLTSDLARTIPSTYVIDIQPSQKQQVIDSFPELTLFANVPSRILAIDEKQIQDLLTAGDESIDRELGREFNLTFRDYLLESESVTEGVTEIGRVGEISVDEEFAKRADIKLGSTLTFLVQGFEVSGKVTSIRATDSRSGLPFFYFVMAPEDIGQFPSVNFGYGYFDDEKQAELSRFLATNMPNVSVIETDALGPILLNIISTLMILIFVIAVPPLLIATLLIATLVISSYSARRREGGRMRALGATKNKVLVQYMSETVFLTLLAAIFSYLVSIGITLLVNRFLLELDESVLYDNELVFGLSLIVTLIAIIGIYLFKSDTMPLRELLTYEQN